MNSSAIGMTANPPYIRFETKAVEKRKSAEEGGEVFYVDTVFANITSHGSKDTVVKIADEWFKQLKEDVRQGRFPQQWYDAYIATYAAWKNDQEPPVSGTAIKNWPAASPAEIKHCAAFGVRAVEDLATANEELIGRLGMGGRSLCLRARDWVQGKADQAPLIAQLNALRLEVDGLKLQLSQARDRVRELEAQPRQQAVGAYLPPLPMASLEERLAAAKDSVKDADEGDVIGGVLDDVLGTGKE
jgi:hypothetical protein